MRRFFLILVAIIASSGLCVADAGYRGHPRRTGFPDQCFDSLDCSIAECSLVVRATLRSETPTTLVAVVTETIKGKAAVGTTLPLDAGYSDSYLPGDDVLLLWRGTSRLQLWRCYALDGQSVVMLMDLQKLTRPADILNAARTIAANQPAKIKTVGLWSNGRMMSVPKNQRLEQLGRQWATEKSVYKRLLAMQALSEFKSEENRKLIEPFLNDTRTDKTHRISKWQIGKYTVREKAAEVLTAWGTEPPALPMSGPLLDYDTINPGRIAIVLVLAGALAVLLAHIVRSRMATSLPLIRWGALSLCVLAMAMLWWRSQGQVDELMFPAGGAHHEIASYSGGIQYRVMNDWNGPLEKVFGSFERDFCDDVWSIDAQNPTARRSMLGFIFASGSGMGAGKTIHRFGLVRIPYWALISLAMIPLAISLRGFARQFRRERLGLCLHCGYDLRESHSGACPECGNEIPRRHPAVSSLPLQAGNEMPVGGHAVGV